MTKLAFAAAAMAALLSLAPAISPAKAETTLCTEITALPFTITAQGVYCLKQNLNVNLSAADTAAITINAGNVTIDFNGFRVNNQAPLSTNQADGVFALNRKHITLKNGFIRGFHRGIHIKTTGGSAGHLVEAMKVADSSHSGITVGGEQSVIRDNRVLATGGGPLSTAIGIRVDYADEGSISGNIVSGVSETSTNSGIHVNISKRVEVRDNIVRGVNDGINDYAIAVEFSNHVMIIQNRMLNDPATGTSGIHDIANSVDIVCRDNESAGFSATPFSDCDVPVDNVIYFH